MVKFKSREHGHGAYTVYATSSRACSPERYGSRSICARACRAACEPRDPRYPCAAFAPLLDGTSAERELRKGHDRHVTRHSLREHDSHARDGCRATGELWASRDAHGDG